MRLEASIDGVTYLPGCAAVPHDELGDVIVDGQSAGIELVARTIVGVPQDQAVALFIKQPRHPDHAQREHRCGRWSVAASTGLDPRTARSIERSVTAGYPLGGTIGGSSVASTTIRTLWAAMDALLPSRWETLTLGENQYSVPPWSVVRRNVSVTDERTVEAAMGHWFGLG